MITGASIGSLGDFICQVFLQGEDHELEYKRNWVFSSYGFLEIGFEAKLWYPLLDRIFGAQLSHSVAIKKVLCDQFIFSPVEVATFMTWTNFFDRKEKLTEKLKRDYVPAASTNVIFWIPVSYACFVWVPLKHRAVYSAFSAIAWDIFMSYATHNNLRDTMAKIYSHQALENETLSNIAPTQSVPQENISHKSYEPD